MKIYISGPITGIEDYKEKFETAEKKDGIKAPKCGNYKPGKD